MRNVVLHQIDLKTDMHAVESMHTDSHGSHAAQAALMEGTLLGETFAQIPIDVRGD